MLKFLGQRIQSLGETQTVEHEEKSIKITGPLSEVFTRALNECLKKDPLTAEDLNVSTESFTDPEVIAEYLKDKAEHRGQVGPTTLYAFDKVGMDERTFIDAALAVANTPEEETLVVVAEECESSRPHRSITERLQSDEYMTALESLVKQRQGHFVTSASQLRQVFKGQS